MKLYILESLIWVSYERTRSMLVRADNELAARQLVQKEASSETEHKERWLNPNESTCKEMIDNGIEEVLMEEINH